MEQERNLGGASRRTVLRSGALGAGALVGAMGLSVPAATAATLPNPPTGTAARDFYLKLDSIPGDSVDRSHRGEIELLGLAWGVKNSSSAAAGGGGGAGKASETEFRFLTPTSIAAPLMFLAVASGRHLASAILSIVRVGGAAFLEAQITLENLILTQYENYPDPEDARPLDLVSLSYQKISYAYFSQDPVGGRSSVTSTWNFSTNSRI